MDNQSMRFAIASFPTMDTAARIQAKLVDGGTASSSISLMGLTVVLRQHITANLVELPFALESVGCTAGEVATMLGSCAKPSLSLSLAQWLLPRHAHRVAKSVKTRCIVLWVRLHPADNERAICGALLTASATPVEVHDFWCCCCEGTTHDR